MRKTVYRTAQTNIKPGALAQAFEALELAGKNLRNTGVFLVKNVLSSFEKNQEGVYALKAGLHANQLEAINEIEKAIAACNATRAAKGRHKKQKLDALEKLHAEGNSGLDEEGLAKARKALEPPKLFETLTNSSKPNPWIVLDGSVFDKALRTHKDDKGGIAFAALPAKFAEQVGMGIRNDFSNWRKSVKAHAQNPKAFLGYPKMPGYMGKRDLAMCKVFAGAVGSRLPTIKDRALFLDYEKTIPLPKEAFDAYAAFDVEKFTQAHATQLRGQSRRGAKEVPSAKPLQVGKTVEYRLVPGRLGSTSFQSVAEVFFEINEESFLAQTLAEFEARPEAKKAQAFEDFAKAKLAALPAKDMPPCSGADLGVNNLAALGHSSGREAWILSAARIDRKLAGFDAKIDARTSALALAAPPVLQALLAKRSATKAADVEADMEESSTKEFADAEWSLLMQHDASARKDPILGKLRDDRENFLSDALHQTSDGIIQEVLAAGSQVLIIGQNKLWKTGSNMGQAQNRRFHRLPHARLIELVLVKAEQASILALCVEESYTSRTSFAAMEALPAYESKAAETATTTKSSKPPKEKTTTIPRGAKPRRQASKGAKASSPKHQMRTPRPGIPATFGAALGRKWERLHADLNGAYNIIRKAMPAFSPAGSGEGKSVRSPSPSFRLRWLSALGPKPCALKS